MLAEPRTTDELEYFQSLVVRSGKGDLLEVIRELEKISTRRGIPITGYSSVSLRQFLNLAHYAQDALIKSAADYVDITASVSSQYQFDPEISLSEEVDYLKKAFWKYGLGSKEDIFGYLTKGDVIEIYNGDALQIYRNFEFFRHCSYSFLDLMTHEWFVLYERPSFVNQLMMESVGQTMSDGKGMRPFAGGSHILRERYLNNKKAFSITPKYIGPLQDLSGDVIAVITTLRADLLQEGDRTLKVRMI